MKTIKVLDQGFISLVDHMGDDARICQAARVSYGNDNEIPEKIQCPDCNRDWGHGYCGTCKGSQYITNPAWLEQPQKDRTLIRYMMRHGHTSPFEMVEFVFCIQLPMDCMRQWIRHRTASVNEYSTRYSEALDFMQQTEAAGWRLQSTQNKQGSSGFVTEWPEGYELFSDPKGPSDPKASLKTPNSHMPVPYGCTPGSYLSNEESKIQSLCQHVYQERLKFGVAKEQARKDLPLSTYTRAYWKCDLHNIFGFLRQRMDSHAQLEIRTFANAMAELVKEIVPFAWEAFEDYQLNAVKLSRLEIEAIKYFTGTDFDLKAIVNDTLTAVSEYLDSHFTNKREREECITKLERLGVL